MAADGGASALLVFPPAPFTLQQSPEMALAHFKRIADATDLPIIVFQYPLATGQGYPRDTLLKMCEQVPSIRAIKDWAGNVPQHEMQIRTLQSLPRPVNVLTTHSAWLFSSLVLGCNGLLSGSGSVIADLQAQLFRAVQRNDLAAAKALNDRIYPIARVFYAEPWVDMHNRMKEALVLLGKLPRAVVRPPLVKLGAAEIERIRQALVEAGLLDARRAARRPATRRELSCRRCLLLNPPYATGRNDMKRQLHLNLFIHSRGHHEASWRHPASSPLALTDIRYYQDLAQRAEAGAVRLRSSWPTSSRSATTWRRRRAPGSSRSPCWRRSRWRPAGSA